MLTVHIQLSSDSVHCGDRIGPEDAIATPLFTQDDKARWHRVGWFWCDKCVTTIVHNMATDEDREKAEARRPADRDCRNCGKAFRPRNTEHELCWSCYREEQTAARDAKQAADAANAPDAADPKGCERCGKDFQPIDAEHTLCKPCWRILRDEERKVRQQHPERFDKAA